MFGTVRWVPAIVCIAVVLSSCAYSTKPGRLREGLESVAVPYFENRSTEPDVEVQITEAIIDGLIRDRTLKLVEEPSADALVMGSIKQYRFREAFFGGDRQAEEYEITIAVEVTVVDRVSADTVVGPRTLTGKGSYLLEEGSAGEEAARDEAVDEIVTGILNLVIEGW